MIFTVAWGPDLMDQTYDFLAPPKIVFGWGRRREVGPLARELGTAGVSGDGVSATCGGRSHR